MMKRMQHRTLSATVSACWMLMPVMAQTIVPEPPKSATVPTATPPAAVPPATSAPPPSSATPPTPPTNPAPAANPAPPPRLDKPSPLGVKPDWTALREFDQTLSRAEFEAAAKNVYLDTSPFLPPWRTDIDGVSVQTGDPASPEMRIAFTTRARAESSATRTWRRAADLPPLKGRPPLSDIHFAIDAGHIGGGYAVMEERFLSFAPGESIQEGNLTLLTAQVLAERLKVLGAYVSLVRERQEPVTSRRPANFTDTARQILTESGFPQAQESYAGLTGDAKIITVQWQSEKLFYRVAEIHARAKKINETIKPDVVLCLHYNAEAWGDPVTPRFSPANHMHVLVNGCYSPNELQQSDVRFEMLRRIFSHMHEEELPLAEAVADGLHASTGLPAYVYTTPNARHVGNSAYVYARNLLANRIYQCPVVYLEPYVMNHEETYRRLLNGHFIGRTLIAGKLQTSVIEDYVRGVVNGVLDYYQKNRPQ